MLSKGEIVLSKNDQYELSVLAKFREGKLTRVEAALKLSISERQVSRKSSKLAEQGVAGIFHGNKGKAPANRTPNELKLRFVELYRNKYSNFNMKHALEKIKEEHHLEIPYSIFQRWCDEAKIQKFVYRRAAPRNFRERFKSEGKMLQMDGSPHKWNGKDEWCLITMIDDATSDVPHSEFFDSESTQACMAVLRKVIELKGIPECIYVDRAGLYGGTAKRSDFSQFGRACEELGIQIIYANSAQGKGRVERSFRTCQDRLLAELNHEKITTMEEANKYLAETFLPNYWNKRLTVEASSTDSAYRSAPNAEVLEEVFCLKETRQVRLDHTISIDNEFYAITSPDSFSIAKRNVEIRTYANGTSKIFFNNRECKFKKLVRPPSRGAHMKTQISAEYRKGRKLKTRRSLQSMPDGQSVSHGKTG